MFSKGGVRVELALFLFHFFKVYLSFTFSSFILYVLENWDMHVKKKNFFLPP